ncbi:MAG: UrcA family protein [Candidatus Andeanibacterium colombiense]|uniref:UrcA family protein n=1 Tax=Candidatus Andeanibacterium colombiense TaxID=3121345 RepID=A0AAJ5X7I3_9SPHN|nr:MAG: UrcA family protein [Sphingomonadaceae bacterium]
MRAPLFAAALGAALAAQPAFAESVTVPYKDLDLSTAAGQKQLGNRIDSAARKVCGFDQRVTGTRIPDPEARACVADARKKIEQRVALLAAKADEKLAGN